MSWTPEEKQKYIDELKDSIKERKRVEKELEEKQETEEREARKKQAEQWTKKHSKLITGISVAIIIIIIGIGGSTCFNWLSAPPGAPKATTPEGIAMQVLGTPESDTDSGILLANYDGTLLYVEYQFYSLGLFEYEKEASSELAPMFKQVFEYTTVNEVLVEILGPFKDNYGNYVWKPTLTLGITRNSYEMINWDNMYDHELYKACDTYWKRPGLTQ